LTKRPERAAEWPGPWPDHIWLGTTCGHPVTKWRIEYLRRSQAKVRFLSAEPQLASLLPINLDGIHQVIVGGESGVGFRKLEMAWARELRDECERAGVAYFFKQDSVREGQRPYLS
jgi:protein gp37